MLQHTGNRFAPLSVDTLAHRKGRAGRITQTHAAGFCNWAYLIEWCDDPGRTALVMDFEVQPVRPFTAINGGKQ